MDKMIQEIIKKYAASENGKTEAEITAIMQEDARVAEWLMEAKKLIRAGKNKEGLHKAVDAMHLALKNAGIESELDRINIIQGALIQSL